MALTRPKYSQIYDTDWKQSVEIASTADVGNLILGNTQPNSIDGVTVLTNWRVLVKDQNNGAQNGIYVVRSAGTGSNGWWTRSLDAAQSNFVTAGLTVAVISGSVNGGKEFRLTTPDPITLGTTVLTFIDPNAAAGAGGANAQVQFNDLSTLAGSPGFTFNKTSNVLTLSGNIVTTSGYFVGNGAFLTGIISGGSGTVNYTTSNSAPTSPQTGDFWYNSSIDVLFQYTDDGVGNVWVDIAGPSIQASGVVFDSGLSFTGNISSTNGYFLGNGSQLTGIVTGSSYSNVQVATYLPTYSGVVTASNVAVAGNVTATYFIGNGSQLTGITTDATSIQSGTSNVRAFSSGNVTISVAGTANAAVFTTSNIIVGGVSTTGPIITTKSGSAIRAENGSIFAGQNGTFVNAVLTNTINAYTGSNIGLSGVYNFNDVNNIWAANVYVTTDITVGRNLTVKGEINTSKTVTALNILNPFLLAGM